MFSVRSWSTSWSRSGGSAASWRKAGGEWKVTAGPASRVWERWRRAGVDWRISSRGQQQTAFWHVPKTRAEFHLPARKCDRRGSGIMSSWQHYDTVQAATFFQNTPTYKVIVLLKSQIVSFPSEVILKSKLEEASEKRKELVFFFKKRK